MASLAQKEKAAILAREGARPHQRSEASPTAAARRSYALMPPETATDPGSVEERRHRLGAFLDRLRDHIRSNRLTVHAAFNKWDKDQSGHLEMNELRRALGQLGYRFQEEAWYDVASFLDENQNGTSSYPTFFMTVTVVISHVFRGAKLRGRLRAVYHVTDDGRHGGV